MVRWLKGPIRFSKSIATGIVASILDFTTLVILVEVFHVFPQIASFPALIIGSSVQFLGNRNLVFSGKGAIKKQVLFYIISETISFSLISSLYYYVVTYSIFHYTVARPMVTFFVFSCYSYPIWSLLFHGEKKGGIWGICYRFLISFKK